MEELNKLRRSVNLMKAQMSYLRDHVIKLDETVQQVGDDLDAFIDVYTLDMKKVSQRLDAIEKRLDK
ncbi:hypothetical protein [Tunicatimonas pelagia]|uniref:hypothetical protein n=1 Tax=Tunicatimonas pelagia TaxID=931531 RepID=UPI002666049E|nr:hypothetical protein [Tunicatimonas pelagia]WKN44718.1 hypothetical protein P0M28_07040 [Tunicatimonas pelagia]